MMMHWVVLANEARARIVEADELLGELSQVADLVHPESRWKLDELKSDRPGRIAVGGAARSAMDPHTEPEQVEARRFAREIAATLKKGRDEGRFERIVLAAPPKFLGQLRAELDPRIANCVVAELCKDFTRVGLFELPDTLRRNIPDTAGLP